MEYKNVREILRHGSDKDVVVRGGQDITERLLEQRRPDGVGFGACMDCTHFQCVSTGFDISFAKCYEFSIKLSAKVPVTDCTAYSQRGALNIWQLYDLAWEIGGRKDKVVEGFKGVDKDE